MTIYLRHLFDGLLMVIIGLLIVDKYNGKIYQKGKSPKKNDPPSKKRKINLKNEPVRFSLFLHNSPPPSLSVASIEGLEPPL